ncbi:MAG: hypothetical protein ACR2NZ_05515 [Rubripirellula sp.]
MNRSRKRKAADTPKAIITPRIDALCGGGISLIIAVFVIAFGHLSQSPVTSWVLAIELYMITDVLINGPHFMASYRLLYSKQSNFRKHPWVTMAMPMLGFAFIGYVIYKCFANPAATATQPLPIITVLNFAAPVFLGWHYVGQSWGMTASFAFLSGFRMTIPERRLIRCGFYALFLYHVTLACEAMGLLQQFLPQDEVGVYFMRAILSTCRVAVLVTFFLGLWGFIRLSQREQKHLPMRVWLPWLATYSWYVMVDVQPSSLFLVQGFHALQYLMFPVRVEVNEHTTPGHRWPHLIVYYVLLVVLGVVGFHWADLIGGVTESRLPIVTATFVTLNLHHYFIDAVVWKIRDPEVRHSLFGHLEPATT